MHIMIIKSLFSLVIFLLISESCLIPTIVESKNAIQGYFDFFIPRFRDLPIIPLLLILKYLILYFFYF